MQSKKGKLILKYVHLLSKKSHATCWKSCHRTSLTHFFPLDCQVKLRFFFVFFFVLPFRLPGSQLFFFHYQPEFTFPSTCLTEFFCNKTRDFLALLKEMPWYLKKSLVYQTSDFLEIVKKNAPAHFIYQSLHVLQLVKVDVSPIIRNESSFFFYHSVPMRYRFVNFQDGTWAFRNPLLCFFFLLRSTRENFKKTFPPSGRILNYNTLQLTPHCTLAICERALRGAMIRP